MTCYHSDMIGGTAYLNPSDNADFENHLNEAGLPFDVYNESGERYGRVEGTVDQIDVVEVILCKFDPAFCWEPSRPGQKVVPDDWSVMFYISDTYTIYQPPSVWKVLKVELADLLSEVTAKEIPAAGGRTQFEIHFHPRHRKTMVKIGKHATRKARKARSRNPAFAVYFCNTEGHRDGWILCGTKDEAVARQMAEGEIPKLDPTGTYTIHRVVPVSEYEESMSLTVDNELYPALGNLTVLDFGA